MKSFSSYISEARLINSDRYPLGTEISLTGKTWISTELLKMYDEGSIFTVHREVSRHRTISPVKSGRADVEYWVKAPDGKIFKLIGSVSAIQDTFGNVGSKERGSGGKLNATKFEKDIVNEILKRNNKKKISGSNDTPAAINLAKQIVNSLTNEVGAPRDADALSGHSGKVSLSPLYVELGLTNGEPKTDIAVTIQKRHLCTVKKKEGSQFASAQAGECAAVIQAIFHDDKAAKKTLAENIAKVLKQGMDKGNFYKLKDKYPDFNNLLARVFSMKSNQTIKDNDIEELQNILEETGLSMEITAEMSKFLGLPANRKKMFTEFITGSLRFDNKDYIPDTIFAWGEDGSIYWDDVYKYIDKAFNAGAFAYTIRDRGTRRGGAFRFSGVKLEENEQKLYNTLVENFNREIDQMLLQEGILDALKRGVKSVVDFSKNIVFYIAELVKKLYGFVAGLISKGIGYMMKFFGLEVTATIQWGPF